MFGINLKHSLATVAVAAGVLAAAASASAATHQSNLIAYNGHAGLGTSAYQHNQTDREFLAVSPVSDGTSNTIMFGVRAAASPAAVIESIGTKYTMFSADAYVSEMGVRAARHLPDIDDEVL